MNTLEKLQAHLATPVTPGRKYDYKDLAEPVRCKDGSTMSVQASHTHYCTPRDDVGPYTHVEVWRCGSPAAWSEYGDGEEPYAYLPIELVAEEIDRRGGMQS
jgi:hypothetical protein